MGMDVNDIKVLMNSGFQYLMKTCHQWAKDHPLVSGVLLFFYLLYIFLPSIFGILFYSFPLVICTAILLGGSRISQDKHPKSIKNEGDKTSSHNGTSVHRRLQRPHLQSQLSRRTFGKDKSRDVSRDRDPVEGFPGMDDPTMHINSILEEEIMPMKLSRFLDVTTRGKSLLHNHKIKEPSVDPIEVASRELSMYAALPVTSSQSVFENSISGKTQSFSRCPSSSSDSESEDDEPQDVRNKAVEWTEDDQRNLMDLGSSEIERNQRLESLMEKRKAKKILSMQPRRNHLDYLGNYYSRDHHLDRVGSVMLPRPRATRNPFDLPYEPQEERPVLRGGSFEEEFFADLLKELHCHDGFSFAGAHFFGQLKDDPVTNSVPCFIPKPLPPDKVGFSRFKRESDVEDNAKEEVRREVKKEEDSGIKQYKEENPPEIARDETRLIQDRASENKGHQDGAESSSSSSSSSKKSRKRSSDSSRESRRNVRKNDTCRSSERKGLICLTAPRNKGCYTGKGKAAGISSSTFPDVSRPTAATCNTMEERSYYSSRPRHHKPSPSIASDVQVEVSEAGSPSLVALDLNSPTDRESLVYDADVDRDANSGDEDFWGTSPHPMRLGSFGPRSRLPDVIEDNNSRGIDIGITHNAHDPPVLSRELVGEAEHASGGGITAALSPMPGGTEKEVVDQKSTNGEIIESKTSVSSSSSESLDSQKQGKSQHLAEYLACLHSRETDSSTLEGNAEEIIVQEERNCIFKMDEDKEESKETPKIRGQSHARDRSEMSKGSSSASNECIEDLGPFSADKKGHSKISEDDESTVLEKHEREVNPREVITDSFSTTTLDDIGDQSRPGEKHHARPEKEMKTTSGNHAAVEVEVEVEVESPNINHEESTSLRKATGEANHVEHDTNPLDADHEISKESKAGSPKAEDTPESMRTTECHMELPSSIEVNQNEVIADSCSTTSLDDIGDPSRAGEEHHAKSEEEMQTTSGNRTEVEVKAEPSNMIDEESTSSRKATEEPNHVEHDTNAVDVEHEISAESKAGLLKTEDMPESVRTKESQMELPSSTEVNPQKVIGDSFSTTSHDNIGDQSRLQEEHAKSEKEMKTTSENHMEVEVKAGSPNMIHDESTSLEKGRGEANDADHDTNALDVDHETNKESKVGVPRTEGAPESESVRTK